MRLFFLLILTALSFGASAQQDNYKLVQQWLDLESQKGKLQLNWQASEQALKNQLALLQEEKAALNALLKNANEAKSEVDAKRLSLTQQQVQFESNQSVIVQALGEAYLFIKRIVSHMPPPIQQDWSGKLNTFEQTSLSTSEKLERLLSMFKSADEFDQRVAINSVSMSIPTENGESLRLVNQIYLGLSYAWYISSDGNYFGLGRVEQEGWKWYHQNQALQAVGGGNSKEFQSALLAIKAILEKPTQAQFVKAPVALAPIDKDLL